jgi:hypothetical protein
MLRFIQLAAFPLLLCAPSAQAQKADASQPAATPQTATKPALPNAQGGTAPRHRTGRRTATVPAVPSAIIVTGKGDNTGTGDGTGSIHSSSLSIPQIPNAFGITQGTKLHVRLRQPVDSAHAHNGDMADGVLTEAAGSAPAGSPVKLTIVAASAAGQMSSAGELSLQVVSINGETVLSNVITVLGETGKTYLADDEPNRGTEAIITPDNPIELPAA